MEVYYTTEFGGFYPVGTSAIVVAHNAKEARELLKLLGKEFCFKKIKIFYIIENLSEQWKKEQEILLKEEGGEASPPSMVSYHWV